MEGATAASTGQWKPFPTKDVASLLTREHQTNPAGVELVQKKKVPGTYSTIDLYQLRKNVCDNRNGIVYVLQIYSKTHNWYRIKPKELQELVFPPHTAKGEVTTCAQNTLSFLCCVLCAECSLAE